MNVAETLIELGAAPVEVARPLPDGTCSCRDGADCRAPGKHPVGKEWLHRAVARRQSPRFRVPAWVRLAPATSYGLVPTRASRLVVIDRDRPDVLLPMPPTLEVRRPSAPEGKAHYWFIAADDIDLDDVPRAFAGGEVRVAESGHVVGPGCRHKDGDLYESNGAAVGYADRELIDALSALRPVRRGADGEVEAVLGSRHEWLTRQARKYRGWGWEADRILEALHEDNETKCVPPLAGRELADIDRMVEWAERNIAPDRVPTITRRTKTWEVVRP